LGEPTVRTAFVILLAGTLAACGMKTDTPEDKAATMASLFNKTKGLTAGAMAKDLSARADGNTMVLTFKNAMEDGVTVSEQEAKTGITQLVCGNKNYTDILDQGVALRVEMFTNGGKAIPPVQIDACPGHPAKAG
jgi:hypothetical protein